MNQINCPKCGNIIIEETSSTQHHCPYCDHSFVTPNEKNNKKKNNPLIAYSAYLFIAIGIMLILLDFFDIEIAGYINYPRVFVVFPMFIGLSLLDRA